MNVYILVKADKINEPFIGAASANENTVFKTRCFFGHSPGKEAVVRNMSDF